LESVCKRYVGWRLRGLNVRRAVGSTGAMTSEVKVYVVVCRRGGRRFEE
jgi:hypothetical protein